MPTTPEEAFKKELEYLRRDIFGGMQLLYAHLTFLEVATRGTSILDGVNEAPLFWNTTLYAWQCGYFIALHRIFDTKQTHHVGRVLALAKNNPSIFSTEALAQRKRSGSPNADEWLPDYLRRVHVPTSHDFTRLEQSLSHHKNRYDTSYRKLRSKVFAHRVVAAVEDVRKLFSKTNVRELKGMYLFLAKFYEALWELLHNGRKPVLLPLRHSVKQIIRNPRDPWQPHQVHEAIVGETKHVLEVVAAERSRN